MPTLKQIEEQMNSLDNVSKYLGRKEIKELPNILQSDETLINMIQGTYNNGNGLLVATDHRLLFIDKGMFFGLKVEDFSYDKISSIQYEKGLFLGKITIMASGNKAVIDNVSNSQVKEFGDMVRNKINKTHTPTYAPAQNRYDQLEKLAAMRDKGILTEAEFLKEKERVLG